jgi:hypothetical protein
MVEIPIILSATWVVVALLYLEGDVFRMFSADFIPGKTKLIPEAKSGKKGQLIWLALSIMMIIPILMVFLTLALDTQTAKWSNIIAAGFFFLFNLMGIPTYTGWYDRFMLVVSLIFNVVTIVYALRLV